ncbi:MAG: hypothetical protein WA824_19635 [Candidatus Sulfotelmatobacter sp.]
MASRATMRALLLAPATLILSGMASPQRGGEKNQDRADMPRQEQCYRQARQYVADENVSRSKLSSYDDSLYRFAQAHYDPKTQICFAEVERSQPSFPPGSALSGTVETIKVVDAFEGKTIASFVDGATVDNKTKDLERDKPSDCQVNGATCTSWPGFNSLLWKLIPAFRPALASTTK